MNDLSQLGRVMVVVAVLGLGIQAFITSSTIYELEPVPAWIHGQIAIANLTGFFLVAIAIGLLIKDLARLAAVSLAGMLLFWVLLLHLPLLIPHPAPDLSFTFETLALAGVAWSLAQKSGGNMKANYAALLGQYAYAISLIAFCAVNFIYHDFIAQMIPAWIPAHLFWAYFTGIVSLAAGISILTGVWMRTALTLTGIMYGSWVLIIHTPYVAAHLDARGMWTDMFITLGLSGGAWSLTDTDTSGRYLVVQLRKLRLRAKGAFS